jgi:hypothetical protein
LAPVDKSNIADKFILSIKEFWGYIKNSALGNYGYKEKATALEIFDCKLISFACETIRTIRGYVRKQQCGKVSNQACSAIRRHISYYSACLRYNDLFPK